MDAVISELKDELDYDDDDFYGFTNITRQMVDLNKTWGDLYAEDTKRFLYQLGAYIAGMKMVNLFIAADQVVPPEPAKPDKAKPTATKIKEETATTDSGGTTVATIDSGSTTTTPELTAPNFGSTEKLEAHFSKHNGEFSGAYSNSQEYLEGARDVMKNGYKVQYDYKGEMRTGYVSFMKNSSKTGEAKFEFVGTNLAGEITTYHVESGTSFWKMLNGTNIHVINPID